MKLVENLEDFILNIEIANFLKFYKNAHLSQRKLLAKLLLILTQANLKTQKFDLTNNNLPIISYLAHNSFMEIKFALQGLKKWLGNEQFSLNLSDYNLPIINGNITYETLSLSIDEAPISWSHLKEMQSNIGISIFPDEAKKIYIKGSIQNNALKSTCSIDTSAISSKICFLSPYKKFEDLINKCRIFDITLPTLN